MVEVGSYKDFDKPEVSLSNFLFMPGLNLLDVVIQ